MTNRRARDAGCRIVWLFSNLFLREPSKQKQFTISERMIIRYFSSTEIVLSLLTFSILQLFYNFIKRV